MANQAEYDQLINPIKDGISKISEYKISDIIREKELGSQFSFKEAETSILSVLSLFKRINVEELGEIPYNLLNTFKGQLEDAISRIDQMINFNPSQGNPVQQRNTLIQNIQNQYDGYYQHSMPIITSQMLNSNDLSIQQARYNQIIEEIEKQKEEDAKKSTKYLEEMERALKSTQDSAAKSGVTKYSALFKDESEIHKTEASFWLKCTIGIITLIVVASIILIVFFPDNKTEIGQIVQYTVSKIIILSALFFGLSLCNRNFKAHKHNEVVNKHRQNALATFETFSNAAGSDIQTKNAVLIEATKTIFSNQRTGYLSNSSESESSNKIVEIIKGVSTKSE
ncbi:MAG: hypothetical protein OEW67_10475 [Cyclobacteriaceae bacterium]|nr:hypothetical protein [Cyclobacteriaceae bacterium]